jgi:hypothetical protein
LRSRSGGRACWIERSEERFIRVGTRDQAFRIEQCKSEAPGPYSLLCMLAWRAQRMCCMCIEEPIQTLTSWPVVQAWARKSRMPSLGKQEQSAKPGSPKTCCTCLKCQTPGSLPLLRIGEHHCWEVWVRVRLLGHHMRAGKAHDLQPQFCM